MLGVRLRGWVSDALSLADAPDDDDDLRLRKRLGVAAGYATIGAVLTFPFLARGEPVAIGLGAAMAAFCAIDLAVLARTRRFERYIAILATAGSIFVTVVTWVGGGITSSASLVWGFLVPAFTLLALGPDRAARWYAAFLAIVFAAVSLELMLGVPFEGDPYPIQLVQVVVNTVAPLTIVFAMLLYSDRRRRAAEARSDELLTNAIPHAIARRLKHGEQHIADLYPETTVLFADLAGFTPWAQGNDPARVAAVLDGLFSRFDALIAEAHIEKIKTIGDSYMAVSGAPEPRTDHAQAALAVALAMLATAADWRRTERVPLEIRIGLASGPVAGGVIGERRILFDLWGDTVNTAARMESSGEPGRIQVAESTRRQLGEAVTYERREVDIKGIGAMVTYLIGAQPAA